MTSRSDRNNQKKITIQEAERAVYIDFEGFVDHTPSILGILVEDNFQQIALNPILAPAAAAKGMSIMTLQEAVKNLHRLVEKEQRLIVAYSQHECDVIREFVQIDISPVYRDARMIAKRWRSICHPDVKMTDNGLKDFLKFIDFPRGTHLGNKKSTSRLRPVMEMLAKKHGDYQKLTAVVKAKWTKLLEHNEIDCRGMAALVNMAARETNGK